MFSLFPLTGVAQHVLDVTTGFTPLFFGLLAALGVSFLGLVLSIGKDDEHAGVPASDPRDAFPVLPKAA